MTAGEATTAMVQQLSRQLHVVSEIAESLTLRILALEEQVESLETGSRSAAADALTDEASRQLLEESSDRLRHLQGLLEDIPPESDSEPVCDVSSPIDADDHDHSGITETVYVDDPQIEHLDDDNEISPADAQIDLLSA